MQVTDPMSIFCGTWGKVKVSEEDFQNKKITTTARNVIVRGLPLKDSGIRLQQNQRISINWIKVMRQAK